MEIKMFVPKGFRAREKAALQRSRRSLVAQEVRDQRHAVLTDQIDAQIIAAQTQLPETEQTNSPAPVETVAPVSADASTNAQEADETKADGDDGSKDEAGSAEPKSKSKKKASK
jgi:hypothetical protein